MDKKQINIIEFRPELAVNFDSINRQWIEKMFTVEDIDDAMLRDPQKYIIDTGGYIWFAEHRLHGVVGTCALLNKADGIFELTKMGVLESARGLKVGETLLSYVLNEIHKIEIKTLFLLTNHQCEAAIHLYEKCGFVHDKEIMQRFGASYERCNVAMRL